MLIVTLSYECEQGIMALTFESMGFSIEELNPSFIMLASQDLGVKISNTWIFSYKPI